MTHSRPSRDSDGGFALLVVLWMIAGVVALTAVSVLVARDHLQAVHIRMSLAQAEWRAEGCLARIHASIDEALAVTAADRARRADAVPLSVYLDRMEAGGSDACVARLRPVGLAVDVNTADATLLRRLLVATGTPEQRADSLAGALVDLRESEGPFHDVRQLARTAGWSSVVERGFLDAERGRVALNHAPLDVLAALPGLGAGAIEHVAGVRERGERITSLLALAGALPEAAADSLMAVYPSFTRAVTLEPEGWIAASTGVAGDPQVAVTIEVRLLITGNSATVVRRKMWIR